MSELKILLVDDYPIIRHGLRTLLETRPGWRIVSEAATGKTALQKAKRSKPEIIVLHLVLPEVDGLDLIPEISSDHLKRSRSAE